MTKPCLTFPRSWTTLRRAQPLLFAALLSAPLASGCAVPGEETAAAESEGAESAEYAVALAQQPDPDKDPAAITVANNDQWINQVHTASRKKKNRYDSPLAYKGKNKRRPMTFVSFSESDPASGKMVLVDRTETDEFGNSRFGAGYTARAQVVGQRDEGLAQTVVEGEFDSFLNLFDRNFPAIFLSATATSEEKQGEPQQGKVKYVLQVYGKKVTESTLTLGTSVFQRNLVRRMQSSERYTITIPLWVEIIVSGQAFAEETLDFRGNLNVAGLDASLTPAARFWVVASAGLGGSKFGFELSAGVQGSLNLLTARAPVTSGLKWNVSAPDEAGRCRPSLTYFANGNLTMRELDGTYGVYARACAFSKCWSKGHDFGSWSAFEQQYELFNVQSKVEEFPEFQCAKKAEPAPPAEPPPCTAAASC